MLNIVNDFSVVVINCFELSLVVIPFVKSWSFYRGVWTYVWHCCSSF